MNARILLRLAMAALLVSACDEPMGADGGVDAGQTSDSDGGPRDAGSADGGSPDAGPSDGGSPDGGPSDAGEWCGDGVVQSPETCDGDCPTECDDATACTADELTGSAEECTAMCSFVAITTCENGDGCCAAGCDATTDDDCSPSCGNGTIEAGETCDGDCPTSCDDTMACTMDMLVGSAASCSAECSNVAITICSDGDGCCASSCDALSDSDCAGPIVTTVAPTTVAIGSPLAVMGAALGGATAVTIGGTSQTFTAAGPTMLGIAMVDDTTPIGAAQPVVVTTPDGTSAPVTVDVVDRLAVLSAANVDATTVEVTFSRALDATTVAAGDFTIAGLTVDAAAASGATVTLTTSSMASGTPYTVTASGVTDTFGNDLTGTDSAMFTTPSASVILTDFASSVTATSHPAGAGAYRTWYDAHQSAFAPDPVMSTLEGMPAMDITDGGFTNGIYAIFSGAVPATGNYRVEVRMHVIEDPANSNGVRAYQIGVATGAAAVHRGPNTADPTPPSAVAALPVAGDYATMTPGDDTALGPITVTTPVFAANAGDDVLIGFGTDVTSGAWNVNATTFGTSHVLVGDVMLVPVP